MRDESRIGGRLHYLEQLVDPSHAKRSVIATYPGGMFSERPQPVAWIISMPFKTVCDLFAKGLSWYIPKNKEFKQTTLELYED